MILEDFTLAQAAEAVLRDLPDVSAKADREVPAFGSRVLHARRFPVQGSTEYTAPLSRDTWTILFEARRRSDWKRPLSMPFCTFALRDGLWAMAGADCGIVAFGPHFFRRYRERTGADEGLQTRELMKLFFRRNKNMMTFRLGAESSVFNRRGQEHADPFAFASGEGFGFGGPDGDGKVTVFRTFVTRDMLSADQLEAFGRLEAGRIREEGVMGF